MCIRDRACFKVARFQFLQCPNFRPMCAYSPNKIINEYLPGFQVHVSGRQKSLFLNAYFACAILILRVHLLFHTARKVFKGINLQYLSTVQKYLNLVFSISGTHHQFCFIWIYCIVVFIFQDLDHTFSLLFQSNVIYRMHSPLLFHCC